MKSGKLTLSGTPGTDGGAVSKTTTLSSTVFLTKTITITLSDAKGTSEIVTTSVFPVLSTHTYVVTADPITVVVPVSAVPKASPSISSSSPKATADTTIKSGTETRTADGAVATKISSSISSFASSPPKSTVSPVTFTSTQTLPGGVLTTVTSISFPAASLEGALPTFSIAGGVPADGAADPKSSTASTITKSVVPVAATSTALGASTSTPAPLLFTGAGLRREVVGSGFFAFMLGFWLLL